MHVNTMTYLFFLNQSSNRAIPTGLTTLNLRGGHVLREITSKQSKHLIPFAAAQGVRLF